MARQLVVIFWRFWQYPTISYIPRPSNYPPRIGKVPIYWNYGAKHQVLRHYLEGLGDLDIPLKTSNDIVQYQTETKLTLATCAVFKTPVHDFRGLYYPKLPKYYRLWSMNDSVGFEHCSPSLPVLMTIATEVHSWLAGSGRLWNRETCTSHVRGLSVYGNIIGNVKHQLQSFGFNDLKMRYPKSWWLNMFEGCPSVHPSIMSYLHS